MATFDLQQEECTIAASLVGASHSHSTTEDYCLGSDSQPFMRQRLENLVAEAGDSGDMSKLESHAINSLSSINGPMASSDNQQPSDSCNIAPPRVFELADGKDIEKDLVLENPTQFDCKSLSTPQKKDRVRKRGLESLSGKKCLNAPPNKRRCRPKVADDPFSLKRKGGKIKSDKPVNPKKDASQKRKYVKRNKDQAAVTVQSERVVVPDQSFVEEQKSNEVEVNGTLIGSDRGKFLKVYERKKKVHIIQPTVHIIQPTIVVSSDMPSVIKIHNNDIKDAEVVSMTRRMHESCIQILRKCKLNFGEKSKRQRMIRRKRAVVSGFQRFYITSIESSSLLQGLIKVSTKQRSKRHPKRRDITHEIATPSCRVSPTTVVTQQYSLATLETDGWTSPNGLSSSEDCISLIPTENEENNCSELPQLGQSEDPLLVSNMPADFDDTLTDMPEEKNDPIPHTDVPFQGDAIVEVQIRFEATIDPHISLSVKQSPEAVVEDSSALGNDFGTNDDQHYQFPKSNNQSIVPYGKPSIMTKKQELLVRVDNNLTIVSHVGNGALVPSAKKKKKVIPHVAFDSRTLPMWTYLMEFGDPNDDRCYESEESKRWWEEERRKMEGKVRAFIAVMHKIQGNRRFSRWIGSVLDSVMGVFLTQNVSDHLSSSAYMTLAARYPLQKAKSDKTTQDEDECIGRTSLEPTESGETVIGSANEPDAPTKKALEVNWIAIKTKYDTETRDRTKDSTDSVDWEAVMRAPQGDVAEAIKKRGQHNVLAAAMQKALKRIFEELGSLDLEWLRGTPPQITKDFLLSIEGLGLKSVECVRLLALEQVAFPVDTNVGRIAVRLDWVTLKDVPEGLQFHLLEQYPMMDAIQKYLWPRLCKLDQPTLYELHYQLITFGKVFCKKRSPYCNACPLKASCKFFTSAYVSAKLAIKGKSEMQSARDAEHGVPQSSSLEGLNVELYSQPKRDYGPFIEIPPSPEPSIEISTSPEDLDYAAFEKEGCESMNPPTVEMSQYDDMPVEDTEDLDITYESMYHITEPDSPNFKDVSIDDIEDFGKDVRGPTPIYYNDEEFIARMKQYMEEHKLQVDINSSNALMVVSARDATIPARKLKKIEDQRTEILVYEIPDSNDILNLFNLEQRDQDDPCFYLLLIRSIPTPEETATSSQRSSVESCSEAEIDDNHLANNYCQQYDTNYVWGTFMIPCRTAMHGRFPLNGTYFQVNEVFADHETSVRPVKVPRSLLWNLSTCNVYCGTSTSGIVTGMTTENIQECFWSEYICVRAFDRRTREPQDLVHEIYISKTEVAAEKKRANDIRRVAKKEGVTKKGRTQIHKKEAMSSQTHTPDPPSQTQSDRVTLVQAPYFQSQSSQHYFPDAQTSDLDNISLFQILSSEILSSSEVEDPHFCDSFDLSAP